MRKGFIIVTVLGLFLLVLVPILFYSYVTYDKKIVKQQIIESQRINDNTILLLNFLRTPCDKIESNCEGNIVDYIVMIYLGKGDKKEFEKFTKPFLDDVEKNILGRRLNLFVDDKSGNIINVGKLKKPEDVGDTFVNIPIIGNSEYLKVRLHESK